MRRHDRKSKYMRGSRRHGKGNIKNRRGAGNRGGRGRAGMHKHKFSYTVKYEPDAFGRRGFFKPKKKIPSVNLWQIENFIKSGALEKRGDMFEFNFDGKILGSGFITQPVLVRAKAITKKAKAKIESVGGKVELLGGKS